MCSGEGPLTARCSRPALPQSPDLNGRSQRASRLPKYQFQVRRSYILVEFHHSQSGNSSVTTKPPAGRFEAKTFPPCASTTRRVIARPSPYPVDAPAPPLRKKGSKIAARSPSNTPGPLSATCAPGMARYFVGESPMARLCRAEGKEKGKGVAARRGLKEAQSKAAGR